MTSADDPVGALRMSASSMSRAPITGFVDHTIARRIVFASSRIFPGQECCRRLLRASADRDRATMPRVSDNYFSRSEEVVDAWEATVRSWSSSYQTVAT